MLRSYTSENPHSWDDTLPLLAFAYNNAVNDSTGYTPFFLNYGFHPRIPCVLNLPPPEKDSKEPQKYVFHKVETAADACESMAHALQVAKNKLSQAQDNQKKYADAKRVDIQFKLDEYVLLSTKTLKGVYKISKFEKKFIGPFKIIKVVSEVNYKLDLRNRLKVHNVFHVCKLKKFHGTPKRIDYLNGEFEILDEKEQITSCSPPLVAHKPIEEITTAPEQRIQSSPIVPIRNAEKKIQEAPHGLKRTAIEVTPNGNGHATEMKKAKQNEEISPSNLDKQNDSVHFGKKNTDDQVKYPDYNEFDTDVEVLVDDNVFTQEPIPGKPEKVPESILKCRIRVIPQSNKKRPREQLEYLVKYKNQPEYENEWLSIEELKEYPEMLQKFDANPVIEHKKVRLQFFGVDF